MTISCSRALQVAIPAILAAGTLTACSGDDTSTVKTRDAGAADGGRRQDAAVDASFDTCPPEGTVAPDDVFCIGLYADHDVTKHVASALAYTPGVVLWSDGAEKQRYFSLPAGTKIDNSDMDAWKFPVGTKAWKEFRVDGALIETRMIWKQAEGNWVLATYIWNADTTEAALNTSRTGTLLDSGYEIPSGRDCGKCHHGGSDKLLGVEAVALALPKADGMTLTSMVKAGMLSDPPTTTRITLPEDASGKAGEALGFLHANCGMPCHSSRGLGEETQLLLRLRADQFWPRTDGSGDGEDAGVSVYPASVETSDAYTAALNMKPTTASVAQAFPDAERITPGKHDASLLWLLAHRRGKYQMPPLVSHKIDEAGTKQLADWIDSLAP